MFKIGQVAEIAEISIKTLRHYDKIGLLVPKKDKFTKYRFYSNQDLIKLNQIKFYKELDFSLSKIKDIFDVPNYLPIDQLKSQRDLLNLKINKYQKLVENIDKTVFLLENNMENILMLSNSELYQGISPEKAKEYQDEAYLRWGETVKESEMKIKKLGKDGWAELKRKGKDINKSLANLMDKYPEHPDVQEQVILWHDYINNFYNCSPEMLLELGKMYSSDIRFKNHYDEIRYGLANFITKAIEYYYQEKIYLKRH